MMLILAGIFFLAMLILNVNKSTGNRIKELASNESVIQATALAESMLEEIQSKAFDEKTVNNSVTDANLLSPVLAMGKDNGEKQNTSFDDIDDYNNYIMLYKVGGMGDFNIRISVDYVKENSPDKPSSIRTFLKRIRVAITNQYLPTELIFNRLISY